MPHRVNGMKKTILLLLILSLSLLSLPVSVRAEADDPVSRMTFFGESTTAHLALRGGIPPAHVLSNASGTMKLDSGILSRTLTDPVTHTSATVSETIAEKQPEMLVLSFGLNGIMTFSEHPEIYLRNYRKLIDAVQKASPGTRILIQSVYPVADLAHQSDWRFSDSPAGINRRLTELNRQLREFCDADPSLSYLNTAAGLYDTEGFLRADYTTDGIHLTEAAYREVLRILRESVNA